MWNALRGVIGIACAAAIALSGRAVRAEPDGDWRAARWGMTVEEVLKAFPGEATRVTPSEKLKDGNEVAIGIEKQAIGATAFRVRFVFDAGGRLVAVSLRTDPKGHFGPDVFEATRKWVEERLGAPAESTSDDGFIDMRQVTWRTPRSRVDVKYIPGVVVVLYTPASAGAAGVTPAPAVTAPASR